MVSSFTEKDKSAMVRLGELLGKAKFTLDIQESVDLTRCLMVLKELPKKIDDHIFEIKGISQNPEPSTIPELKKDNKKKVKQ